MDRVDYVRYIRFSDRYLSFQILLFYVHCFCPMPNDFIQCKTSTTCGAIYLAVACGFFYACILRNKELLRAYNMCLQINYENTYETHIKCFISSIQHDFACNGGITTLQKRLGLNCSVLTIS